ncbi:MAG: glycoside hydrolase family 13 protein [Ilumatobacteraceae bacterium]
MTNIKSNAHLKGDDWWRRAVVYQIYPKSFADGNGDGIGDLSGARARLDYLRALGIDAVWFSPFFPSPQCDGGYDVSDYRDIDPMFGTLADAESFIREAHARGIRVILDIVPNHSSSKHRFFVEALATLPGSPAWARYHCVRGRGANGELPPNNWQSIFGGLAWTQLWIAPDGRSTLVGDASVSAGSPSGWWYLHLFDTHQPDVNWDHPDIVREFDDTLRFWFDRGVDGIRIDVAQGMIKQRGYPDVLDSNDPALLDPHARPYFDQPEVHEIYRRWRKIADSYDPPRVFVAEAWLDTPEKRARYLRADELHTGFNFDLLTAEWNGDKWRDIIDSSMAADALVGAPTTWVTENHDVRRSPTRYGGRVVHREVASPEHLKLGRVRALAAMHTILALPGTTYLFNGQELGLEEVIDLDDAEREDPHFHRTKGEHLGRDGCRVPMPWRASGVSLGFGPDGGAKPWLSQPAAWATLSVESQEAVATSSLQRVRTATAVRRAQPALQHGDFEWMREQCVNGVVAFRRSAAGVPSVICIANMGSAPTAPIAGTLLCASGDVTAGVVPPDTTAWFAQL